MGRRTVSLFPGLPIPRMDDRYMVCCPMRRKLSDKLFDLPFQIKRKHNGGIIMNHSSDILNRLKNKLNRYLNSSHLTSKVIRNLGTEKNWQRMLDYLEYAYRIGEKLDPKRILMESMIIGLRNTPDAIRKVKRRFL